MPDDAALHNALRQFCIKIAEVHGMDFFHERNMKITEKENNVLNLMLNFAQFYAILGV